jgi:hypothetical protein
MLQTITILILSFVLIFPFIATATFRIPDTGQTKCYQTVDPYAEISCDGTGQDGAYQINPMSYTDNGDGTVTDNITGLVWQQQVDNQSINWYQASGTFDPVHNPGSTDACGSLTLGGHSDWRLPSKKELISILDYSIWYPNPTINQVYFPNTIAGDFWSSTPCSDAQASAWGVFFGGGMVTRSIMDGDRYVRCVRGGREAGEGLFDNGDGIVIDGATFLMWQQDDPGMMSWGDAMAYCEGLTLSDYTDWRLPNVKEAASLLDDNRSNPAIDKTYFKNAQADRYWPSTILASNSHNWAWYVDFASGYLVYSFQSDKNYVRCVRGGAGSVPPVRIAGSMPVYFTDIYRAHDRAENGDSIQIQAAEFPENLTVTKSLNFVGGFDSGYTNNGGYTTIQGLTIKDGSITLERIVLR